MKKVFQLLFLFVISINAFSQSLTEKMESILNQIGNNIPADQLFLHIDRNIYHPGDTIRFQAYIRDRQTGVFETKSCALYVLLLNSNHATIDSARFRIFFSTASGWLKVPDTIQLGDYSILAFTSSDMNYSPEFAFMTLIKIDNIRPAHNETNSKSINEDFPISQVPTPLSTIDLRFLPEGGTFIYGIQQRLAFNAVTSNGRVLDVTGIIINQKGEKITQFASTPYGPGVVEFTPLLGDTYFATLNGEEFNGLSWPLPSPERSGVAMRVNNAGNGLIDIILKGRETDGTSYFLTVTMNNVLIFKEDVKLDTLYRVRIKTDEIPSGSAFVTLYDHELNPIVERLIFLNVNKKMKVNIGVSSPFVNPGDETKLTIHTTDEQGNNISSIVSVAVIDSVSGYNSEIPLPEIESTYLYDRKFYNNLPLRIKSIGLKNIDSKSIDILLMTYGWRKFTLKEVAQSNPEIELVNYDYLKISNPGPEKKGMSGIKLISLEDTRMINLKMDQKREAILFYDSLDVYARQIMILPDDNPLKNSNPVTIVFPENKDFTEKAKNLTNNHSYSASYLPVKSKKPDIEMDTVIMIEPVTIRGHRQSSNEKVYVDKNNKLFQYTGIQTLYNKDLAIYSTFEDILYKVHPFLLDTKSKKIYLRAIQYFTRGYIPALFVVDGSPIYDKTYMPITSMPASEIASVSVLSGMQGFGIFGNEAYGGVIFVTTKTGNRINGGIDPDKESRPSDYLMKQVRLFRTETEYYTPTKKEIALIPEYQFRPTILWKNDVFIDSTGSVKLKYPNNLVKGTAIILVNGVSFTKLIGSNRYSYKVK
jgi:alpha-2-macroglobulin-like protein